MQFVCLLQYHKPERPRMHTCDRLGGYNCQSGRSRLTHEHEKGLPMGSIIAYWQAISGWVNRIPVTHGTWIQAQTLFLNCLYSGLPKSVIKTLIKDLSYTQGTKLLPINQHYQMFALPSLLGRAFSLSTCFKLGDLPSKTHFSVSFRDLDTIYGCHII